MGISQVETRLDRSYLTVLLCDETPCSNRVDMRVLFMMNVRCFQSHLVCVGTVLYPSDHCELSCFASFFVFMHLYSTNDHQFGQQQQNQQQQQQQHYNYNMQPPFPPDWGERRFIMSPPPPPPPLPLPPSPSMFGHFRNFDMGSPPVGPVQSPLFNNRSGINGSSHRHSSSGSSGMNYRTPSPSRWSGFSDGSGNSSGHRYSNHDHRRDRDHRDDHRDDNYRNNDRGRDRYERSDHRGRTRDVRYYSGGDTSSSSSSRRNSSGSLRRWEYDSSGSSQHPPPPPPPPPELRGSRHGQNGSRRGYRY